MKYVLLGIALIGISISVYVFNQDAFVENNLKDMSAIEFEKEMEFQLYSSVEQNQKLFNKNVQAIEKEFQDLALNMGTFHEYAAPIAENSGLLASGGFAASFFIPGFDNINSTISFIAEVDSKINSYLNATKNSKINVINQKINTFLSTYDIKSIDDIRTELNLYRVGLLDLSADLKEVLEIAILIKEFSVKADNVVEDSVELGKKLLGSFFSDDKSEKTAVTNSQEKEDDSYIKSLTKAVTNLKIEIEKTNIIILESSRLADNLSSSLMTIKNVKNLAIKPNNINIKKSSEKPLLFTNEKSCDDGNVTACLLLASEYYNSKDETKDLTLAKQLFKKSCEGGNDVGCVMFNKMLYPDNDVQQSVTNKVRLDENSSFALGNNINGTNKYIATDDDLDTSKIVDYNESSNVVLKSNELTHKNSEAYDSEIDVDDKQSNIFPIISTNSITKGGSGLVIFKAEDENLEKLIIETNFGKEFKPTPFYKEGYYAVLIAWPLTEEHFSATIVATDKAGNKTRSRLSFFLKNKKYRTSTIKASESFINGKITDLAEDRPNETKDLSPAQKLDYINATYRDENNKIIQDITSKVDQNTLEHFKLQPFYPLKNGKVVASHGDHRYYKYKGEVISEAYHLGIDLASVKQADILITNPGAVVFANYNGIYGNNLIVYHGLGLYSLYGHCSNLSVQKGDILNAWEVGAKTGATGLALGDHLHFSLLIQGVFVHPAEWMDAEWMQANITDVIEGAKRIIDKQTKENKEVEKMDIQTLSNKISKNIIANDKVVENNKISVLEGIKNIEKEVVAVAKYSIRFNVNQLDAHIEITNGKDIFHQGLLLKEGKYYVQITKEGYKTFNNSYQLSEDSIFNVVLERKGNRNLIEEKLPLKFADDNNVKEMNKHELIQSEFAIITMDYPSNVLKDEPLTLKFSMENLVMHGKGGLSISFPQFINSKFISNINDSGFNSLKSYTQGQKLYSTIFKKNILSKYTLVEGWSKHWDLYDMKDIYLTIKPPKNKKYLLIDIRGVVIANGEEHVLPNVGIVGQQGYINKRIKIKIVN